MVNTTLIQRISYLFSTGWYFKYHRIHSHCLKPSCLPPPTDHKKKKSRWELWTPVSLLEEETHQQRNHQQKQWKKVKERVEATLTSTQDDLEIQLNGGEITHNKQWNKSEREASKPCTHRRTGLCWQPVHTCTKQYKRWWTEKNLS